MATGSSGSRRKPPSKRPAVEVLRVGHRPGRDPRLTTHLALAARALGARRMHLHPPDPELAVRVGQVARGWGGSFAVVPAPDWKRVVREFEGAVVHLTMYGRPFESILPRLVTNDRVLLVVGGAKVPPDLFRLSTYNVAVGSQPHSEVAAVAVLLDRLVGPAPPASFAGAERRVVPRARGKQVVRARRSR